MKYLIFKGLIGNDIGLTMFDRVLYSTLAMKSIQQENDMHDTLSSCMDDDKIYEMLQEDNGYFQMVDVDAPFLTRETNRKERAIYYSLKKLREINLIRKVGRTNEIYLTYDMYSKGYLEVDINNKLSINASVLYSMIKDKYKFFRGNLYEKRKNLSNDFYGDYNHEEAFKKIIHELRINKLIDRDNKQLKIL